MSEAESVIDVPREKRERLIMIQHPKRAIFLFNYVLGVLSFVTSLIYNITTAGLFVPYDLYSWIFGIGALLFGVFLVGGSEARRRYTFYIITTWNVRVREGYWRKNTKRIFYDEIDRVESEIDPEERVVQMGDVKIYSKWNNDEPELIFDGIHNPDGILEIIKRMIQTTPEIPPWNHLDCRAKVMVHK